MALGVDRLGPLHHILHLAAVGPGVHGQRAADGAGNAAEEFEAGEAGLKRRLSDVGVQGAGADAEPFAVHVNGGKSAAQADHHAVDAAVPDQQIGAHPDGGDLDAGWFVGDELAQVAAAGGAEDHLGRAAHPEPRHRRQRHASSQAPLHRWQPL